MAHFGESAHSETESQDRGTYRFRPRRRLPLRRLPLRRLPLRRLPLRRLPLRRLPLRRLPLRLSCTLEPGLKRPAPLPSPIQNATSLSCQLLDLDPQGRRFGGRCSHDKICTAVGPLSEALNPALLLSLINCKSLWMKNVRLMSCKKEGTHFHTSLYVSQLFLFPFLNRTNNEQ